MTRLKFVLTRLVTFSIVNILSVLLMLNFFIGVAMAGKNAFSPIAFGLLWLSLFSLIGVIFTFYFKSIRIPTILTTMTYAFLMAFIATSYIDSKNKRDKRDNVKKSHYNERIDNAVSFAVCNTGDFVIIEDLPADGVNERELTLLPKSKVEQEIFSIKVSSIEPINVRYLYNFKAENKALICSNDEYPSLDAMFDSLNDYYLAHRNLFYKGNKDYLDLSNVENVIQSKTEITLAQLKLYVRALNAEIYTRLNKLTVYGLIDGEKEIYADERAVLTLNKEDGLPNRLYFKNDDGDIYSTSYFSKTISKAGRDVKHILHQSAFRFVRFYQYGKLNPYIEKWNIPVIYKEQKGRHFVYGAYSENPIYGMFHYKDEYIVDPKTGLILYNKSIGFKDKVSITHREFIPFDKDKLDNEIEYAKTLKVRP